jgi:predicted membrane protein
MLWNIAIKIICIILLGFAVLDQPYDYYKFLRMFVGISAILLTIDTFRSNRESSFVYVYLVIALLYNPFIPVYLTREIWFPINIFTIIILAISILVTIKKQQKPPASFTDMKRKNE